MPIAPPSRTAYTVLVSRTPLDHRPATTAVGAGVAFVVLAVYVRARPEAAAWERRVSAIAVHLDGIVGWAWVLGSLGVFVVGLVAAAAIGTRRRRPLAIALPVVAVASLLVVQGVVKPLVGRQAGLVYGFPSGHALSSSFVAVSLVAALWPPPGRARTALVAAAGASAAACGVAAISGQSHLPTDVAGSWLWLLGSSAATVRWMRGSCTPPES